MFIQNDSIYWHETKAIGLKHLTTLLALAIHQGTIALLVVLSFVRLLYVSFHM